MLFLTGIFVSAAAALPVFRQTSANDLHIIEVAEFSDDARAAVGAEVNRRGAATCGDKQVRWGKFDFVEGSGKVKEFRQEFRCLVGSPASADSLAADWSASDADAGDVRRLFDLYDSRRRDGDFAGALEMFAPGIIEDPKGWIELGQKDRRDLGAGARRAVGLTWYVDPPAAERKGVYAAVDFVSNFAGAHVHCGYVIFYRLGPGRYQIVREETTILKRQDPIVSEELIRETKAAACRG